MRCFAGIRDAAGADNACGQPVSCCAFQDCGPKARSASLVPGHVAGAGAPCDVPGPPDLPFATVRNGLPGVGIEDQPPLLTVLAAMPAALIAVEIEQTVERSGDLIEGAA